MVVQAVQAPGTPGHCCQKILLRAARPEWAPPLPRRFFGIPLTTTTSFAPQTKHYTFVGGFTGKIRVEEWDAAGVPEVGNFSFVDHRAKCSSTSKNTVAFVQRRKRMQPVLSDVVRNNTHACTASGLGPSVFAIVSNARCSFYPFPTFFLRFDVSAVSACLPQHASCIRVQPPFAALCRHLLPFRRDPPFP